MSRVAVLFKTHRLDPAVVEVFRRIEEACRALPDHIALFSVDTTRLQEPLPINASPVDERMLERSGFQLASEEERASGSTTAPLLWYHTDFVPILFSEQEPSYDYVWAIEYDVRFSGQWSRFFGAFLEDQTDFIGAHIEHQCDSPTWAYWAKGGNIPVPPLERIKSFFPVVRFSRRACAELASNYRRGFYGYCEISAPSLIRHGGMTVKDLKVETSFAPFELFRFRPLWDESEIPETGDHLYHPVRT